MALPRFQEGDRVRTVRKLLGLPQGSQGTVVRVLEAAECSDVRFDAQPRHQLIYHGDLELVERTAEARPS
jgi:hypothetical protein